MGEQACRDIPETRTDQTGDRRGGRGQGSSVPLQGTRRDRRVKVEPARAWKSGQFTRLGAFATGWPFRSLNLAPRKGLLRRWTVCLHAVECLTRLLPSFDQTSVDQTCVGTNSSWEECHGRWASIWWLGWGLWFWWMGLEFENWTWRWWT